MNGYDILVIGAALAAVAGMVAAVYYLSRKAGPVRAGSGKKKIFACGESAQPEELNVLESGFFKALGKVLMAEKLRDIHSGDLSNYLAWIFIGMLALIMVMVMGW